MSNRQQRKEEKALKRNDPAYKQLCKNVKLKNNKESLVKKEITADVLKDFANLIANDLKMRDNTVPMLMFKSLQGKETLVINCMGGALFSFSTMPLANIIGDFASNRFFNEFPNCKCISAIRFPRMPECIQLPFDNDLNCLITDKI